MRPIIVWLRRDLRVDDNTALFHASNTGAPVIPLFIFDAELIKELPSDGATFDIQARSLRELSSNITSLGGRLIVRFGRVLDVHRQLIKETAPAALYFNRDYEPYAVDRDARTSALYRSFGIQVRSFKDLLIQEPTQVLTAKGGPFAVYTPFANAWKRLPIDPSLGTPSRFVTPALKTIGIMGASELGRRIRIAEPMFAGGESEAKSRWQEFLRKHIGGYGAGRDFPGIQGTSRMSPYLRFGCISIRTMLHGLKRLESGSSSRTRKSITKYVDELIWREFYQSVLYHFPRLIQSNFRVIYDRLSWNFDEKLFGAWKNGKTGFPFVDAGMRELLQTGWMHNRARMVVASFLTKDLLHDWRLGELVFREKLLDIETASNVGGWQWAASTGVDAGPLRIFNPRLQAKRFDPEGSYIKRFVPELQAVPSKFIHAPHEMPPVLQKELGCKIGRRYPAPILDHAAASNEYIRAYRRLNVFRHSWH